MVFENVTMNLSALGDISPPNISLNADDIVGDMISTVNSATNGYYIFGALFIIGLILYWVLSDTSIYQDFSYDYIRALNISLATCVLIGLTLVEVGWSPNFYAVGFFTTLWFLSYLVVLMIENKE